MSKEVAGLAGRHSWEILGDDWRVVFCGLGVFTVAKEKVRGE